MKCSVGVVVVLGQLRGDPGLCVGALRGKLVWEGCGEVVGARGERGAGWGLRGVGRFGAQPRLGRISGSHSTE